MKNWLSFFLLFLLFSCNNSKLPHTSVARQYPATSQAIGHYGRTVIDVDSNLVLIGSASYAEFVFTGDSCVVYLKNIAAGDDYNYVVVELDETYIKRIKVDGHVAKPFPIKGNSGRSSHLLRLFKATESHNGQVALTGVEAATIKAADHTLKKRIEFIGNSITCGMGNDTKEIPCGTGRWYDQHNAYWAYGPRLARALQTDFMLSSVSGIGIYRNWNSNGPTMPQVYESAYLQADSARRWDFARYTPDIVSICLGTNDFSDGDGKQSRLPFDSTVFIRQYVGFIGTLYQHYPATQIALLTSPMLSGPKADLLLTCLESIRTKAAKLYPGKPGIALFRFQPMIPKGCSYHPDSDDHTVLADELIPFFRTLLNQ